MPDESKPPEGESPIEQLDRLRREARDDAPSARVLFRKTAQIGLLMAYDLIDKLRYVEKQTSELPENEVAARLAQLARSVEQLRMAYLTFSDLGP